MIELEGVVKTYARPWWSRPGPSVNALDGVDLHIRRGAAVAIVGLNGAGKSTLVRTLLGYIRPTEGTARIDGLPPRIYVQQNGIAYIPEKVAIPDQWTVREALRAYAMMGNLADDAWDRVDRVLDRLGLGSLHHRRIGALSKGNVQRVAIAQAILGDRTLMILDEPTDGLDPVWIVEFRSILREWRDAEPGRTLVLASHDLSEVERLVDEAILLHNGRIRERLAVGRDEPPLEQRFLDGIRKFEEGRP